MDYFPGFIRRQERAGYVLDQALVKVGLVFLQLRDLRVVEFGAVREEVEAVEELRLDLALPVGMKRNERLAPESLVLLVRVLA